MKKQGKKQRKYDAHLIITIIVRVLFIAEFFAPIIIWAVARDDVKFINMFTALLGFALTFIPDAIDRLSNHRLRFSNALSCVIILFIFAAEFLGEINDFYELVPWWDTMLHTVSGVILGLIGFMLVYVLNENEKVTVHLSPVFICFFAFCFAMAAGAIWEIFEFAGDRLLGMNMQKYLPPEGTTELVTPQWCYDDGLIDTMGDIICDFLSALATSVGGYILLKVRGIKHWKAKLTNQ